MVTPDLVQDMRWGTTRMTNHIHMNHLFNTVPDFYEQTRAQIWERNFEQGMEKPRDESLFEF